MNLRLPDVTHENWFVSVLGFGQVCAWGSLYYSYPLIVEAMMPELGWSRTQVYGPATMGLVLAAFLTYPVGVAVDRGYSKLVLAGCSLLVAAFFFMWSQAESYAVFYVLATLLGALQACVLYEPAFATFARRVGAARARGGITHITLWGGFASTVFIPLVQYAIDAHGWREALILLGVVNLSLCGLYVWWVRPELDYRDAVQADTRDSRAHDRAVVRDMLHNRVFWLLLFAMLTYAAAFSAFTFHMYPLLLEGGLSVREVVLALTVIGPAQVAGRVLISTLGKGMGMRRVGSIIVGIFPMVFIALAIFDGHFLAVVMVCGLYGAANGIFTIVRSLVVPEMLTPHAYGAMNGLINLPATLARAMAPWATAVLWSVTHSYGPVLWAIIATSIVLAGAFWAAARVSVLERPVVGSYGST